MLKIRLPILAVLLLLVVGVGVISVKYMYKNNINKEETVDLQSTDSKTPEYMAENSNKITDDLSKLPSPTPPVIKKKRPLIVIQELQELSEDVIVIKSGDEYFYVTCFLDEEINANIQKICDIRVDKGSNTTADSQSVENAPNPENVLQTENVKQDSNGVIDKEKLFTERKDDFIVYIKYLLSTIYNQEETVIIPYITSPTLFKIISEERNTLNILSDSVTENLRFYNFLFNFLVFFSCKNPANYSTKGYTLLIKEIFLEFIDTLHSNQHLYEKLLLLFGQIHDSKTFAHAGSILNYFSRFSDTTKAMRELNKYNDENGSVYNNLFEIFVYMIYMISEEGLTQI